MEQKYQQHVTRTTKRGGGNTVPDDPFKVEAEVSMDAMGEPVAKDGRNPNVTTGGGAPTAENEPPGM